MKAQFAFESILHCRRYALDL